MCASKLASFEYVGDKILSPNFLKKTLKKVMNIFVSGSTSQLESLVGIPVYRTYQKN
jgi:hypothetical protein